MEALAREASGSGVRVVASGLRAEDMALRLVLAGVPPERVESDLAAALDAALAATPPGSPLTVIATYTAMLELRRGARAPRGARALLGALPTLRDPAVARAPGRGTPVSSGSPALRMLVLYPNLMDVYADRGNVIAIADRCARRGIAIERVDVGLGDSLPEEADLLLIGGGQDREQERVAPEVAAAGERIRAWRDEGVAMLAVCGGYQLFGNGYRTSAGVELPGAGVFDVTTVAPAPGAPRHVGDVLVHSELPDVGPLAGFENHAGRTYLGPDARLFARVERGRGNNGVDGTEGALAAEAVGTYLHGPAPAAAPRARRPPPRRRDAPPLRPERRVARTARRPLRAGGAHGRLARRPGAGGPCSVAAAPARSVSLRPTVRRYGIWPHDLQLAGLVHPVSALRASCGRAWQLERCRR